MNAANVVAAGAFFAILVAGLIVRAVREIARQRPSARVRARVATLRDERRPSKPEHDNSEQQLLHPKRRIGDQAVLLAMFAAWHERVPRSAAPAACARSASLSRQRFSPH